MSKLEHRTYRVGDLITDYRRGLLVIPEFQRDYVWKPAKAPLLLDSLYHHFPVSSLLVWESDGEAVKSRRVAPRRASGPRANWLIDGQQRVITLARIKTGDEGIDVVFHAGREEFARVNAATRKEPGWYRLAEIWDDEGIRRLRRVIDDDKLLARIERVHGILSYEVPSVHMVDHQFDDAVKAFTRINTLGVKLKTQDIESAQVAARHSGFILEHVTPTVKKLHDEGYGRIDVGHLFRACAFLAHPDGRRKTPLHELSTADVKSAWGRTLKGLNEAKTLLHNELGITGTSILSSGALFVPPIVMCASLGPKERRSSEIAGWVALAAILHRYSGSSATALEQDLRACRDDDPIQSLLKNLRQTRPVLQAEKGDFDAGLSDRGALFGVYVAARHLGMVDPFTKEKLVVDRDLDRHHIFPRAQFPEKSRGVADNVANIAFIKGGTNKALGAPSPDVYLRKLPDADLISQCIPTHRSLLELGAYPQFCDTRRTRLAEAFNDAMKRAFPDRKQVGTRAD